MPSRGAACQWSGWFCGQALKREFFSFNTHSGGVLIAQFIDPN
jgi:hypothetical protein